MSRSLSNWWFRNRTKFWFAFFTCYVIFMLVAAGKTIAAPAIRWTPDRNFARLIRPGFNKATQTVIFADGCMRPLLPKGVGITVGVAQEDCLVFARTAKGVEKCYEMVWSSGPSILDLPCSLVSRTIKQDTPAGFLVQYVVSSLPTA